MALRKNVRKDVCVCVCVCVLVYVYRGDFENQSLIE